MNKQLKVIGTIAISLGIIASIACVIMPLGIFFAIPIGFLGLILSTIYIFIDTKNQINIKKITLGIVGMILSSVPVLFMIVFIILNKVKS